MSVAVEQGETSPARRIVDAYQFRVIGVILKDIIEEGKQMIEGVEKFGAVLVGDGVQVADDPADGFKFPFAGQAEEAVIGSDVGEEGEGAATERAVVPLTTVRTEAGEREHVRGQVRVGDGANSLGGA